jgi:hypothetical protein
MAGDHLLAAAEIVAREAQALAAAWSAQVPPSIRIRSASATSATISSAVGPSYPNEVPGVRHPVFGNRHAWVTNAYRPFLVPAAEAKADEAAAEIAKIVDDAARAAGFTVT